MLVDWIYEYTVFIEELAPPPQMYKGGLLGDKLGFWP